VILALLALGGLAALAPLHARYVTGETLARFLLVYGLAAALVLALLAGFATAAGRRHAGALSLCLVLGLAMTLELYTYLLPYSLPTYPSLTASLLGLLLVGGAVFFGWSARRALVVSAIVGVGFALVGLTLARRGLPGGPFALATAVLLIGAALAVASAHLLERYRADLARRERTLVELSARLMSAQEEERSRISRELHDGLGQSLTAMLSYLWLIERQGSDDVAAIHHNAAAARALGSKTVAQLRQISQLLHPTALDVCGLAPALETYVRSFGQQEHVQVSFTARNVPDHLPAPLEVALYRMTQEALSNVARHARATRADVSLALQGAELRLEVRDNGIGLAASRDGGTTGTGLVGISERARALGGAVALESAGGTQLTVRIPFAPPPAAVRSAS
jgi:signal transduction histidine kinase